MRLPWVFLRRDFFIWSSYRLSVVWQILGVVVLMGVMYLMGRVYGDNPDLIPEQSGSYLAFVLGGLAFTDLFLQGLMSPALAIRENQKAGTLEPMLATPITMMGLVFSASFFKFLLAFGRMTLYIALGYTLLGFWREANLLGVVLVFLPAAVAFLSLGSLSAAFIMLVKQGDPVLLVYGAMSALVGGTLFPLQVLPEWVQRIAGLFPLTHALSGIRAALGGAGVSAVMDQALTLAAMSGFLLPLGLLAFTWAVNRSKLDGSLDQY